jgi:uncharacterized membrane protein YcfT
MVWSNLRVCAVLELTVMLFQVFGVLALCVNRLFPATRWGRQGRAGSIVALVGLAIAGALCGRHASEFALFAGVTMTVLLIGMTMGSSTAREGCANDPATKMEAEPTLAG